MTDVESFLEPLTRLAQKQPDLEAMVLWWHGGEWSDATGETLEAEEIAFYAEGLLMEGFGMAWDHLRSDDTGDLIRLCFWQGSVGDLPPLPGSAQRLAGGRTAG